jgi:hypothetical protein
MSNLEHRYRIIETPDPEGTYYLFVSHEKDGSNSILKVVEYTYAWDLGNKQVFNLCLGNYDVITNSLDDESITNKGDAHRVFNTVLNTVLLFFEKYPAFGVLVQGSDGRSEFGATCRLSCTKNCTVSCRKFNRRMKLYCSYVSRNIEEFAIEYQFIGAVANNKSWFDFEDFVPGKLYDGIVVFRKIK